MIKNDHLTGEPGEVQTKALNVDIMAKVKEAWNGLMSKLGWLEVLVACRSDCTDYHHDYSARLPFYHHEPCYHPHRGHHCH